MTDVLAVNGAHPGQCCVSEWDTKIGVVQLQKKCGWYLLHSCIPIYVEPAFDYVIPAYSASIMLRQRPHQETHAILVMSIDALVFDGTVPV